MERGGVKRGMRNCSCSGENWGMGLDTLSFLSSVSAITSKDACLSFVCELTRGKSVDHQRNLEILEILGLIMTRDSERPADRTNGQV